MESDHEEQGRQDRQGLNRSGRELARAWLRLAPPSRRRSNPCRWWPRSGRPCALGGSPGRRRRLDPDRGELHQVAPDHEGQRRQGRQASTAPPSPGHRTQPRRAAPGGARPRRAGPAGSAGPQPLGSGTSAGPGSGSLAGSTKPPTLDPEPLPMVATVAPSACPGRFTRLTAAGSIPTAASCTKWRPTTKCSAGRTRRASTAPPSPGPRTQPRRAAPGGDRPRRAGSAGSAGPQPLGSGTGAGSGSGSLAGSTKPPTLDPVPFADGGHGRADRVPWEVHPTDGRRLEPERGELHQVEPDREGQRRQDGRASTAPPSPGPRTQPRRAAPAGAQPRRSAPAGSAGHQPLGSGTSAGPGSGSLAGWLHQAAHT